MGRSRRVGAGRRLHAGARRGAGRRPHRRGPLRLGADAQRAAPAPGLRRRRAMGAPPRRHDRCGRRARLGVARVRRRAPRTRLRVVRRLHGGGRPAGLVRPHLEPVLRPPAQPGRPGRRRWRRPSGSGPTGRRSAATRGATATPSSARCSRSRRSPTPRPAASSRPRRPRCPSSSAAYATGTTASAGCATRRSPCRPWSRPATPTRPSPGASGCCGPSPAHPGGLQILYGVAGERRVPEQELPWLAGYEGSAPVRVGNGAVGQRQLDVYGEVMDTLWLARSYDLDPNEDAWRMQRGLMTWLESGWREPDEGLWEVRGPRQHFTHSKVLAWVAADRAVRTVEHSGLEGPVGQVARAARRDPRRRLRQGLRRRPRHLHPVLRLPRPRRRHAAHPPGRLPAGRRRAGARHGARHPARALHRRWADPSVRRRRRAGIGRPPGRSTACPATRAPSWRARSGWPTRSSWTAGSTRGARCSSGCSTCATTSACSPRSTTSVAGRQLGNVPRPTATSRWSTRRSTWRTCPPRPEAPAEQRAD